MTDEEIRAQIDKQVHDKLAVLATKLRETAHHHGPVIRKVLKLVADDLEALP